MSEQTKSCQLVVDPTKGEISISGLSDDDLTIGYESDIDLTDLVVSVVKLIDTGLPIALEMPSEDHGERVSLVLGTISDISDAFNASLSQEEESASEEPVGSDENFTPPF